MNKKVRNSANLIYKAKNKHNIMNWIAKCPKFKSQMFFWKIHNFKLLSKEPYELKGEP